MQPARPWKKASIIGKLRERTEVNFGFNAATGEYGDLVAQGVIDPAKVTRSALQNAASISALMPLVLKSWQAAFLFPSLKHRKFRNSL